MNKNYTEEDYYADVKRTLATVDSDNLAHAIIGITTEASELLDAYKKSRFYGRDLNITNLKEEISDIMYYLSLLNHEISYNLQQAMIDNREKLLKRYPDNFKDILVRDTKNELSHIN